MKWFVKCIRNSLNFQGRASRTEFWYFVLYMFLFLFVLFGIASITQWIYIVYVVCLAVLLPYMAVAVRRLHDIGRSGWWVVGWLLVSFVSRGVERYTLWSETDQISGTTYSVNLSLSIVAVVYCIFMIVWFARRGDEGVNKFGPEPTSVINP